MRMKDKVAIVTGAASGIGREIARAFAHEGAKVWIADLTLEAAQAAAAEIEKEGGVATGLAVDVTDEAQVEAAVRKVVERHGAIDVLVSNAGIQHIAPIVELSLQNWRRVLAVHLDGGFLMTRACLRHMAKAGRGGSIIYMGSVHSKGGLPPSRRHT
jgi:3-hydroxybutyrate dehydrogenase